ncbi:MAG: YcaQ family DNA glycosylase [Opitutaceae bacterium]|nr:YcaQ family DNA glycosylase [Opitutaceae bacterium]
MHPLLISPTHARRFAERAVALREPWPDVASALREQGYVQLDPINVCGRMHDLNLRNRVAHYREGDLLAYVHPGEGRPREAFEHYLPGRGILVVFPMAFWPVVATVMAERRNGRSRDWPARPLTRAEEKIGERILAELRDRGPLSSDDIEHEGRARTAWGTQGRLVKHVLEALFHRGDVLICARRDFRRVYDLPERVIPAPVRARGLLELEVVRRELAHLELRQRRLVALRRHERAWVDGLAMDVRVGDGPVLQILREDAARLDAAARDDATEAGATSAQLLAPLDPLIYDRRVTRRVWDFDYTWEVYTPAARRVRGYYALPVLSRGEIVGHVEPRADRADRRLQVVSRRVRRGHATRDAVRSLATFLGLRAPG